MASITSTGIGSGLQVESIITQLMAVEKRPLSLLQSAQSDLNTQLSAVGRMQGLTSTMRDAAAKLTTFSLWHQTVATSSDSASVSVTSDGNAKPGQYAVSVQSLAVGQTLTSRSWTAATDSVGQGTLTIELGRWTGQDPPYEFAAKGGGNPLTLTIGEGEDSLASIRDKINQADAGVVASIITDASGARLSLRSSSTGEENAFRVLATEAQDDGDATTGLSALTYNLDGSGSQMTRFQSAANAQATLNGIPVTSASNTLTDIVDGVSIKLLKTTSADVSLDVKYDDDAVKSAVTDFTKAFNDLASYIREQTKYDPQSKKGGTLQGDRTALTLQSQLRGMLNQESSASAAFSRLSEVGITMQADGTLAANADKLDAAMSKRDDLEKLFAADGKTNATSGFMDRFRNLAAQVLDTGGSLELRTTSLNAMIKRNTQGQDAMQSRLDATEKRLRQQYQALDANMAKLNGLSSYITGQMTALTNQNRG